MGHFLEDDYATACFSVPLTWSPGDEYTVSKPAGFSAVTWLVNGNPISATTTAASVDASGNLVIKAPGIFAFTGKFNGCDVSNCCNIQVVQGPCSLSAVATAGVCNPATNLYSTTVVVGVTNPVAGLVSVTTQGVTQTQSTTATGTNSLSFVFAGLVSNGQAYSAQINLPGCSSAVAAYTAPGRLHGLYPGPDHNSTGQRTGGYALQPDADHQRRDRSPELCHCGRNADSWPDAQPVYGHHQWHAHDEWRSQLHR